MAAEHPGGIRKASKGIQRGEHLLRRTFEQAAAAGAEQGVAAEQRPMAVEGNMTGGVTRHAEDCEFEAERRQPRTIAVRQRNASHGQAFVAWPKHGGAGLRDQAGSATDVIGMVMRREDGVQLQVFCREAPQYRDSVARIDDGNRIGITCAADQPDVIVLEGGDRRDLEHARVCGISPGAANWPRPRGALYALAMAASARVLADWFTGPLGTMLLEQERAIVERSLECAFGLHCLQVGSWGAPETFLSLARTRRTALIASSSGAGAALVAEPSALALQSDSVDVMLLPHTLEFASEPHEVLREVARVLTGEGELFVLGFEPLGGWSLRNRFTRGGFPPGIERTIPAQRLADWLKLTGFEVGSTERFLYVPPLASLRSGRAAGLFERIGRRAWPRLSGAYLLRARKRVYSMTPVRLRSRVRTAVIGGLAEPAARRAS